MQPIQRRPILIIGVVLALVASFVGFSQYQKYTREKQNQEMLRNYQLRRDQQRSFNEVTRAHRERALIKKPKSPTQPTKSPETP